MQRHQDSQPSVRKRDLADRSEEILRAVKELRALERLKRSTAIATPRFHALADDIQAKSREIFRLASAQNLVRDDVSRVSISMDDVEAAKPS